MATNDSMLEKTLIELPSFLINPDDVFHLVRRTITSDENLDYHHHNYAEIFWIKEGEGLHIINGIKQPIKKGMLCMIRPEDTHTFKVIGNTLGLVVTNIAFSLKSLKLYKDRYFSGSKSYFWTENDLPYKRILNLDQLNELSAITDFVISRRRNYMNLDLLILHIFKILKENESVDNNDIPHWLQYAIEQYNTPQQFREGIRGFVALTDRTTDHVNKMIQHHLRQTLTDTVTKIKMNYAAQRLTMTNVPIKTICFNCGFSAIGHFYKVFKKYNGMTPKEYRQFHNKVFKV